MNISARPSRKKTRPKRVPARIKGEKATARKIIAKARIGARDAIGRVLKGSGE